MKRFFLVFCLLALFSFVPFGSQAVSSDDSQLNSILSQISELIGQIKILAAVSLSNDTLLTPQFDCSKTPNTYKNYFVRAQTTGIERCTDPTNCSRFPTTKTDICVGPKILNEYYCSNGYLSMASFSCPAGCSNGVCNNTSIVLNRLSSSSPLDRKIIVSRDTITPNIILGVYGLKAENLDAKITNLSYKMNVINGQMSEIGSKIRLVDGSSVYYGILNGNIVTFSNLNISLKKNIWKDLTLNFDAIPTTKADVSITAEMEKSGIVGVDINGKSIDISRAVNVVGNKTSLIFGSLSVSNAYVTTQAIRGINGEVSRYTLRYNFIITNNSNENMYLSKDPSILTSVKDNPVSCAKTTILNINNSPLPVDTSNYYVVLANESRTFAMEGVTNKSASSSCVLNSYITKIVYGISPNDITGYATTAGLKGLSTFLTF